MNERSDVTRTPQEQQSESETGEQARTLTATELDEISAAGGQLGGVVGS